MFQISYLNIHPKESRTYLKFDNELFLTTNFKQDKINVSDFPHAHQAYIFFSPINTYGLLCGQIGLFI